MSTANELALIEIRPMREPDLDAVMTIENASFPFPWSRKIYEDCLRVGYSCWVAQKTEKTIAYAILSAAAGEAHILNLCVREDYRRDGVGRLLLNHLVQRASELHAQSIFLEVRPSNLGAYRLYEQEGFIEVGSRKNYYPAEEGREDAIIMAKELII